MQSEAICGFRGIFPYLPPRIADTMRCLSQDFLETITEIRLRAALPLVLVTPQEKWLLTENGRETTIFTDRLMTVTKTEIEETVAKACGYSVYSHQKDLVNGYLSLAGGHRIGLCGTAVTENGVPIGIREISSLNFRIAKEIPNAAENVLKLCFQKRLENILLAGPPGCGKTTVLRALAQQLSGGKSRKMYTCAVVDERAELFPNTRFQSTPCFADVLSGYSKADGISLAVRVLSPEIVFCDEIGSAADVCAIADGMRCGVHFAVTAHAETIEQLQSRPSLKPLFAHGGIDTVLLLGTGENLGKIQSVYRVGESDAQNSGYFVDSSSLPLHGMDALRTSA